ncbi:MAG: DUF5602 domain-containing protein [Salinigranum sp.]
MSPSGDVGSGGKRFESAVGRRSVLKATGVALAGGVFASGSAAARGDHSTAYGGGRVVGGGAAAAYTTRTHGELSAVGVRFGASALTGLPTETTEYPLALPRGDTGRFEFVGIDWNPRGHEPEALYGHPHFDFHFYMLDRAAVEAIPAGVPNYDIPAALMPADTYTTADLPGNPSPRMIVPEMGEHLISVPASMPQNPGQDGWSVYIWGAYDPDGDGTGQLTFMEPMITAAYLSALGGDGSANAQDARQIPAPERFLTAGRYPTEYVVRYHSRDDSFTVSLESFEQFAGYGRR